MFGNQMFCKVCRQILYHARQRVTLLRLRSSTRGGVISSLLQPFLSMLAGAARDVQCHRECAIGVHSLLACKQAMCTTLDVHDSGGYAFEFEKH